MRDEKGEDYKVIAVPVADPRFDGIDELAELHPHWLREIENFFHVYKTLEPDKVVDIDGWGDQQEAWAAIDAALVAEDAR
jgi:inorganic pyrophosphatase